MNQHQQERLKTACERIPWVKEKTDLPPPFCYTGKCPHTFYKSESSGNLTNKKNFSLAVTPWEHLYLTAGWGWTLSSIQGSRTVSITNPRWFDVSGQVQTLDYPAASVAAQPCVVRLNPPPCVRQLTCFSLTSLERSKSHLSWRQDILLELDQDLNPFSHLYLSKRVCFLPWTINFAINFFNRGRNIKTEAW